MHASPCACVFGLEQEYLTALLSPAPRGALGEAINAVFRHMERLAPTLPSSSGCFHPYGRTYLDCGHLELASCECDSPYVLADLFVRGERLLAAAVRSAARSGPGLRLVANNHDGVLRSGAATWGSHENLAIERHPSQLTTRILPFLLSRVYAGAGGFSYPSGEFHAGVRPLFMQEVAGGGTTCKRAIHSLAREEHHMGPRPTMFRYHLLVGDAHRMRFNIALQAGATMLALKALMHDQGLGESLDRLAPPRNEAAWLQLLRELNHLAHPDRPPRVDSLALKLQRLFLDGARRFVDAQLDAPQWMPRLLDDWERTLRAYRSDDRDWLCAHLDAFAKFELVEHWLGARSLSREDILRQPELLREITLLEQDYAQLDRSEGAFGAMASRGLIDPQELEGLGPGEEQDPFLPASGTRALARARFLRDHRGRPDLEMSWAYVRNTSDGSYRELFDAFATEYGDWQRP